ncbi:MAG: translation initiation factor IF-6 [Candidatus Aenigmatarchaeota archaeon]
MKILSLNFFGDCNIGLFGKSCDNFCLISSIIPGEVKKKIEDLLKVRIFSLSVAETEFIGLFLSFNSNGILAPKIIGEREKEIFGNIKSEMGINLGFLKTRHTAIGNLVICNDKGAIISKLFVKDEKKVIEDCLGVEAEYCKIAGLNIVGSCGLATNKGCLLHRDASEKEIEIVENFLKVEVGIGTVNFGSPFVSSGIISNSNGILVGEKTTGAEIARIIEVFKI